MSLILGHSQRVRDGVREASEIIVPLLLQQKLHEKVVVAYPAT